MKLTSAVILPLTRVVSLFAFILLPLGCASDELSPADFSGHRPVVRVLLEEQKTTVSLTATQPPMVHTSSSPQPRRLDLLPGTPLPLSLSAAGWRLGNSVVGTGDLTIEPAAEGTVSIDGQPYRGRFRLVPRSPGTFDVVNDVDIDGYLKGVIPRELLPKWNDETYKAQAVVARTYAIYEFKAANANSHFDLFSDQRSQVYGGIKAETPQARMAVDQTSGTVVVSGPPGQEKIFKAYFSSCCGGIGQSAADAFGDSPSEPLIEQSVGQLCSESPRYNWGPVALSKTELTRRFRKFGLTRNRVEKDMATVKRIDIAAYNRLGRPVKFMVTDARNKFYYWTGEEIRWAVNTDSTDTTKLYSSLFQIENQPATIRFINGHGLGHGVGMCQWCAQTRAEKGMRYDQIVLAAFVNVKLMQAY